MTARMLFNIAHLRFAQTAVARMSEGLLFLSNEEEKRKTYLSGSLLQEYGNSLKRYVPDSVFGYADINLSQGSGIITPEAFQEEYLKEFNLRSRHIEAFITFLWFINDNSVGLYGTYGEIPIMKIVNGKSRSIVNYTCEGQITTSTFSEQQLKYVGELATKYNSISGLTNKVNDDSNILYEYNDHYTSGIGIVPKTPKGFSYHLQNRIDKAISFLLAARGQDYVFYKIAYYMPIFECLFNTKSAEIQLRIAQRAAFYISDNPQERKEILDTIIEGYKYRSKFVHGGEADEKDLRNEKLAPLALKLDSYLRFILDKAINVDHEIFTEFNNAKIDEVFDSLLLGIPINIDKIREDVRISKEQSRKQKERNAAKELQVAKNKK